jgi:hypothetical protein
MAFQFRIEPRSEYLYVEITGTWERDDAWNGSLSVLEACAKNKIYLVLMDNRKAYGSIHMIDRWNYANFMADHIFEYISAGKFPTVRLSYLGDELIDVNRFGQLVANNRGVRLIATKDPVEAYTYLGLPFPDSEN